MMSDNSMPVMTKPVDVMENGLNSNSLQTSALQRHPIDDLQRRQATQRLSFLGTNEEQEVRRLYGSGLAMRLATERKVAQEMGGRGVAGIASSNLMFDTLTGNDMKIDFGDFLSLPEHRPNHINLDNPHRAMERKLGL